MNIKKLLTDRFVILFFVKTNVFRYKNHHEIIVLRDKHREVLRKKICSQAHAGA